METEIDFNTIVHAVKRLIILNGVFLLFMSLFRLFFYFYFSGHESFAGLHAYIAQAFILGFRFDLSAIAYVNILVTLSLLIIWGFKKKIYFTYWMKSLVYYYWVIFSIILLILVIDFGFYSYFKDHINVMIYGFFEDDTRALIKSIVHNHRFPEALCILSVLLVSIYILCKKLVHSIASKELPELPQYALTKTAKTVFTIALIVLNALAARGSFRMFPLSPIYGEISPNAFINKLSVNGVFALGEAIKSHRENSVTRLNYLTKADVRMAFEDYCGMKDNTIENNNLLASLTHTTKKNATIEKIQPNVVVIVMESFGANLLRYDSKDFDLLGEMRKHMESDYVFHNFLPAGIITIHALETIILNIVQRPNNLSVTQTPFAYKHFITAATRPYKDAGYSTAFFYGGSLRWRQLDTFLPNQGFDEVIGEGSLPQNAERNEWGVYDEYLYSAILNKLKESSGKPRFIMVMTTTNHPPYSVPTTYKSKPLKIPADLRKVINNDETLARQRFVTYQYANHKLGEFISQIKNSALGKNTIIAVTGDHNFWDIFDYHTGEEFYRYSVPFYLYVPDALKPKSADLTVFGCHRDIMPTLYNLSLSGKQYVAMGNDLFDKKRVNGPVFNSEGFIVSKEGATLHNTQTGINHHYSWDDKRNGMLVPTEDSLAVVKDITYYNAAMVVAEYIISKAEKK
ncbi:MAG: sulfatase-like hydrolase/transferase [Endomicrobiales bacterium]